jgi:hypothetical protein
MLSTVEYQPMGVWDRLGELEETDREIMTGYWETRWHYPMPTYGFALDLWRFRHLRLFAIQTLQEYINEEQRTGVLTKEEYNAAGTAYLALGDLWWRIARRCDVFKEDGGRPLRDEWDLEKLPLGLIDERSPARSAELVRTMPGIGALIWMARLPEDLDKELRRILEAPRA